MADTYTLTVTGGSDTNTKATSRITVAPKGADIGIAVQLTKNLEARVTSLQFEQALVYKANAGEITADPHRELYGAPSGKVLVAVTVELENVGTEEEEIPYKAFSVPDGQRLTHVREDPLTTVKTLPKQPLGESSDEGINGPTVSSGAATSGWLLFQLPVETAMEAFQVQGQRDATQTPAEFTWTPTSVAVPDFTVQEVAVPSKPEQGKYAVKASVKNTGSGAGTARAALESRLAADSDAEYYTLSLGETDIPAGETRTITLTAQSDFSSKYRYRVRPWDVTDTITFQTPEVPFGEAVPIHRGTITVDGVFTSDQYQYDDWGDTETVTAPAGKKFLWAHVSITFDHRHEARDDEAFTAITPNGTTYSERNQETEIVSPSQIANAGLYSGSILHNEEGGTTSGYIGFAIPEDIPADKVAINYSTGDEWDHKKSTARWNPS